MSASHLDNLLKALWEDYSSKNPQAAQIHQLLLKQGETQIINDHVAYRTLSSEKINMHVLSKPFLALGYQNAHAAYFFPAKKLRGLHLLPPKESYPKIFISELMMDEFSHTELHTHLKPVLDSIAKKEINKAFLHMGRDWDVSFSTYEALRSISEYAAWVYAFGFRPNHFTVFLNSLTHYGDISKLNQLLKDNGFILNKENGEIKGSPEKLLEQSSTMAAKVLVNFTDGSYSIPGCYYEFARRYKDTQGRLFQGFISESADKIFESTSHYDSKSGNFA